MTFEEEYNSDIVISDQQAYAQLAKILNFLASQVFRRRASRPRRYGIFLSAI